MSMTTKQLELARHALGLPNDKKKSYRNRFHTANLNRADWWDLVGKGYAMSCGKGLFYLTEKGARAALLADESLCEEDFPQVTT